MGLLEKEIKELRGLIVDLDGGKITSQELNQKIAIYSQVEKRAKLMLQAHILGAKHLKSLNRLKQANFIGDGEAIDVGSIGEENVICPEQEDKTITRDACLEYSGKHDDCHQCDNFKVTQDKLIPA